ncbi:MAG: competence/damage-inducible protein A [Bacteroidales bacterium]|nr:competence/damage-inducible protein A [Bacteroidales bacterium]
MYAEIISIGDELLIGQTINSNAAWMGQELNKIGIDVYQVSTISDDKNHIVNALNDALKRTKLVLITGGLGPTRDDITKYTLAEYFNSPLVRNEKVYNQVEKMLKKRSIQMNDLNRKQADVPEKAHIFVNYAGTAPAMWFEVNKKVVISMPGVPYEMKEFMTEQILPSISRYFKTQVIIHRNILTYGTFEAKLAEILSGFEDQLPREIKLAYLPTDGVIKLRLSGRGDNKEKILKIIDREIDKLYKIIPKYIFGEQDDSLEKCIGVLLKSKNETLCTAESCTGGMIAHQITTVPGSSEFFIGSVIAYSNRIKEKELGVNSATLEKEGAVSRQVVEQMAEGVRERYDTVYSIATSGIAGPAGGTLEKPVGTVWIAVAGNNGTYSRKFIFGNNRINNIRRSTLAALNLLRQYITGGLEQL